MSKDNKTSINPNTDNYVAATSASGAKSQHNGSPVALALVGLTVDEVKDVATGMGVEEVDRYDKLNVGQQRMNLGNRIRGRVTAIDKQNAKLEAAANADGATKDAVKAAKNLVAGEDLLAKISKPFRVAADKRAADALKAKAKAA